MRKLSSLALLFWFSLAGWATANANAQQAEPPPAKNTTPVPRVRQGGNVTAKMLIHKVQPEYPEEARQRRIEGTVRLHVIIARDGSIAQMEVISGDPLLVKSSLDAVRQWRYRPTLLKGEPAEVDTTIDVTYTLNR